MIFVDYIDRAETTATMPTVCMHCTEPTCALVCPADAIKMNEDGVVMSALKPRCLDCRNCVNACPFGVPKYNTAMHLQMKCDMCYDRTSEGLKPMCASVCPTGAISFGTYEQIVPLRRTKPVNADGKFYAYGQKCTHLSCPVYYAKENARLECPCHEGGFNVQTGNVLYGPPPRPLDKIEIEERGGEIWAIGREASQDGHTI